MVLCTFELSSFEFQSFFHSFNKRHFEFFRRMSWQEGHFPVGIDLQVFRALLEGCAVLGQPADKFALFHGLTFKCNQN